MSCSGCSAWTCAWRPAAPSTTEHSSEHTLLPICFQVWACAVEEFLCNLGTQQGAKYAETNRRRFIQG